MAEIDATRACVVCGVLFPRNGKRVACSDVCMVERRKLHQAKSNAKKRQAIVRRCQWCAVEFIKGPGTAAKYCCSDHADLARAQKDKERKAKPSYRAEASRRNRDYRRTREASPQNIDQRKLIAERKRQYRAEHGRGDRGREYAARGLRRLAVVAPALLWIDADYLLAHTEALAINAEFDRAARSAARAARRTERDERDALRIEQAKKRGLAASTLKLKEDPEAYAVCLARWRAKSFKRKTGREMPADGTVSGACLGGKHCIYCNIALTACNRTIDHMTPLVLGGVHSAANIAPCCKTCNASKSGQGFHSYVAQLSPVNRMRAVKFFERMNGPLEQMTLWLAA